MRKACARFRFETITLNMFLDKPLLKQVTKPLHSIELKVDTFTPYILL